MSEAGSGASISWEGPTDREPSAALTRFRRFRRSRGRRADDRFDAFYRLYVTGLLGLFGFYLLLGVVDEATVDAADIEWVQHRGPAWLALVAAVAIAAGTRSGANGGPLIIDDPELHHVLLSPLSRSTALADPTRRLVFVAAGMGAILGAAAGELASRQLPGGQAEWVLSGLLAGVAVTLSGIGAALVAAGSGRHVRVIGAVVLLAPVWAVFDLLTATATSPTSMYGHLALWPLEAEPKAVGALVIASTLTGWGWLRVKALSIERTHHRSRLVRQIRFAMAQQDIRSLVLLRRQLGFETPRQRPWLPLRCASRFEARFPVAVRDARSYLRWPVARLARVIGLAVVAGLALSAMWHGTTALIGVVGAALYVAAIEVIEPLSQELDHPGILELTPISSGKVVLAHVFTAVAAMSALWVLVGGVAAAVTLDWHVAAAVAVAAVPAAAAAVAAAALSIKRFDSPTLVPAPEVEGPRLLVRLLWPPALTLAGALPVLAARNALTAGSPAAPPTLNTVAVITLVATIAVAWLRFRDDITDAAVRAQGQPR